VSTCAAAGQDKFKFWQHVHVHVGWVRVLDRGAGNTTLLAVLTQHLCGVWVCCRAHRLKLLVTSATLDGQKFSAYFNNCPVSDLQGHSWGTDWCDTTKQHSQNTHVVTITVCCRPWWLTAATTPPAS
jgi:hypothetical protein